MHSSIRVLAVLAIAACSGKPVKPVPVGTGSGSGSGGKRVIVHASPGSGSSTAIQPINTSPSGAPSVKVTLAEVGLEASSLDRTADPCVDFYQFACGGWLATNAIPPERARWSRAAELEDRNAAIARGLLEEAAKGIGGDANAKKLGDFYASCMDEVQLEKLGTAPLKPVLAKLEVKTDKQWLAAIAELHKLGVWVAWTDRVEPDAKDAANNVTVLDGAALGLDRDDYGKAARTDAYRAHAGKLLGLAGTGNADDVVAIESELARLEKTPAERRDAAAAYNPTDATGLAKQVKSVDWKAYWKALGVTPSKRIVVATPRYFAALDKLKTKFTWAQWSSYFAYHLVARVTPALPKGFDDERLELARTLAGTDKSPDRARRCIAATSTALGDLLAQAFAAKAHPPAARASALGITDALVRAFDARLAHVEWMAEPAQKIAQQKLAKTTRLVGVPDRWHTYDFNVRRDDFLGNALRAAAFDVKRRLDRAGKPVDRADWQVDAFAGAAGLDGTIATLPAGALQPPFFGQDRAVAANMGGLALLFARQLVRGVGEPGMQWDADGNLKAWLPKDDRVKYEGATLCLAEQYDGYEALPKQFVSGKQTLAENSADQGGVKIAFDAYRALRHDAPKVYVADGFTEDQQFFLAVAQAQCTRDRPAEAQRRLAVDPESPPKFRVYGTLRNLKEFTEAFSCAPGTPMHPAKVCSVW